MESFLKSSFALLNPEVSWSHLCGLGPLGSLGGWMCMNGLRINMGFGPSFGLWPSPFSVLALDHGPHCFMLQNRQKNLQKRSSSKIYVQM